MPKFQENTGFKLPGLGSKEIDTPGVFRKEHGVEDVGYCKCTEPHMMPKGSSPLLKSTFDSVVPDYYKTSYTRTNWPVKKAPKEETQTADRNDNKETKGDGRSNVEQTVNIYNSGGGQEKKDYFSKFLNNNTPNTTPTDKGKKGGINKQGQILTDTTTRNKGWDDLEKQFINQGITGDALTEKMNEAKAWRKKNPDVKNIGMKETKQTFIGPDGNKISEKEYRKIFGN